MKKILLVVMLVMISTLCYSGIYVKYQGYVDTDECTYLSMSTSSWIYAENEDDAMETVRLFLNGDKNIECNWMVNSAADATCKYYKTLKGLRKRQSNKK